MVSIRILLFSIFVALFIWVYSQPLNILAQAVLWFAGVLAVVALLMPEDQATKKREQQRS